MATPATENDKTSMGCSKMPDAGMYGAAVIYDDVMYGRERH
jgi:hypothetical protein